ncbi:MAG: hypothetical protein ACRDJU_15295, partial [Actinomycetota bacterium]
MSVIEDLLTEGMAERVSAVRVPDSLAGTVWHRFRRQRARRRAMGMLATVLALVGLGTLLPGLLATHGDPVQTATEPAGSPAPTALKAQLLAALNSDEASIERETVTGAPGASGPIEYWYDPETGQSLSQALSTTGQGVLAEVASLEAKTAGQPLTVTAMDFMTKTWATATVSAASTVPVPIVAPTSAATPIAGAIPVPLSSALAAQSGASSVATVFTPAEIRSTLESGDLLLLGHETIDGQDTLHLVVDEPKLGPTPTGDLGALPEPATYELWVDATTGQPIRQVVMSGGGTVQAVYTCMAPG